MTKKTLWMLTGTVALSAVVAGCGTQKSVALPNHTKTVHHHKQAVPATSVSSTAPTSPSPVATTPPANPMATYNYPTTVAAGVPAVAQPFDFQFTATTGKTPPPPTGGLAGPNGQAAAWAIGQRGAIVLFIDPTNPQDAWDIKYAWVPAAQKYHIALDLVDAFPNALNGPTGVAGSGNPPASATAAINPVLFGSAGQYVAGESQTLPQMASTMATAVSAWALPSWVHVYEISEATAVAWHVSIPVSGAAADDPTLWVMDPPLYGQSTVPTLSENLAGAIMTPAQVRSDISSSVGNLP